MNHFTPYSAIIGGALIGLAAVMLMAFNGRIAGISGISAGTFNAARGDRLWRVAFVAGLIGAPILYTWISGTSPVIVQHASLPGVAIAGLLVGLGTQLGSGCTSGHGVCGIARFSPPSLLATVTFITAGVLTVALARLLSGIAS